MGGLKEEERRVILEYYLSRLNKGEIDLDRIVKETSRFTPADIQYLFELLNKLNYALRLSPIKRGE